MLTAAAVRTAVYFHRLGIAVLFFAFCPDMAQLPAVMTDVVMLIFKNRKPHVVIFPNIFFIGTGLAFLVVLKLDIARNPLFLQ